ncbi:MAG: hypothetical protein KDB27_04600 [Planctomycetales bacterium]|nr:hypothetical protein [Planctomycetales bacterium]
MRSKELATSTYLDGWRTARVSKRRFARLCTGRLETAGLDYQVLHEDRDVRIVVRRPDLSFAIELIADIAKPVPHAVDNDNRPIWAPPLLIGIPVGGFAGSLLGYWLGIATTSLCVAGSVLGSLVFISLFALFGRQQKD